MPTDGDDLPRDGYSTSDVVALTGATHRQLDYWAHCGYVTPKTANGQQSGSGVYFVWAWGDVQYVRQVVARLKFGLTLKAALRGVDPYVLPTPADPRLRGADVVTAQALLCGERRPQEEVQWTP